MRTGLTYFLASAATFVAWLWIDPLVGRWAGGSFVTAFAAWLGGFAAFVRDPVAVVAIIASLALSRHFVAVLGICAAYGAVLRVSADSWWRELGRSEAYMNATAVSRALSMCAGICLVAGAYFLARASYGRFFGSKAAP